jgi:hypothetical protein
MQHKQFGQHKRAANVSASSRCNRVCRFARHLCQELKLWFSVDFLAYFLGRNCNYWRYVCRALAESNLLLHSVGSVPARQGVCVVWNRIFYELASESCFAGGVQYFRRGWIWLCRLAGTDSLPQVPASRLLSESVKWKMHHFPEAFDYCCRSLNVNHVTDAQIERRFKEVSPAVLAQAYNQVSRM